MLCYALLALDSTACILVLRQTEIEISNNHKQFSLELVAMMATHNLIKTDPYCTVLYCMFMTANVTLGQFLL